MINVKFFNAVYYNNQTKTISQSLLETADDYFFLSGKKAYVIPDQIKDGVEGVVLSKANSPFLLTALKVISFATVIIPIIFLAIKATLRYKNHFHLIDPKAELESGVNISPSTIKTIQELMPKILGLESHTGIQKIKPGRIFQIDRCPDYIFKMASKFEIEHRFANMVHAKEVCMTHHLDLLIVPQAKMFEVQASNGKHKWYLIAEKWYPIKTTDSAQAEIYKTYADSLDESVHQLATFIALTRFNDVIWRNIPVLDDAPEFQGHRRIGLIDLEHMESANGGFTGYPNGSVGLVRSVFTETQINRVLAVAKKQGIYLSDGARAKKYRLEEIEEDRRLFEFYEKNGILEDRLKPISVILDTLGLNLDAEGFFKEQTIIYDKDEKPVNLVWEATGITLRGFAVELIAHINELIQSSNQEESVKGARKILLNTAQTPISQYTTLSEGPFKDVCSTAKKEDLWINQVINALVTKGHLFKLIEYNNYGYFIQA